MASRLKTPGPHDIPNPTGGRDFRIYKRPPLADLAEDACEGKRSFTKSGPCIRGPSESEAEFVERVRSAAELTVGSARVVAAQIDEATTHNPWAEARRLINNGAKLNRRDEAAFVGGGPTVVRGDLSACTSPKDLDIMRPSLCLSVAALRSLRFPLAQIRSADIALFWILLALHRKGFTQWSPEELSRLVGGSLEQLELSITRLQSVRVSCNQDRDLKRADWIFDLAPLEIVSSNESLAWDFDQQFLAACDVKSGSGRYAYLELQVVMALSTARQEQCYRTTLAAAAESLAYSSFGGTCTWTLTPSAAAEAFGLTRIAHLSRDTVSLLDARLRSAGSRLGVRVDDVARDQGLRGRGASLVVLTITCAVAPIHEWPRDGKYLQRTALRQKKIGAAHELSGEWRIDAEARRVAHKKAVRDFRARKRGPRTAAADCTESSVRPEITVDSSHPDFFDQVLQQWAFDDSDSLNRDERKRQNDARQKLIEYEGIKVLDPEWDGMDFECWLIVATKLALKTKRQKENVDLDLRRSEQGVDKPGSEMELDEKVGSKQADALRGEADAAGDVMEHGVFEEPDPLAERHKTWKLRP